ncbi:MAG: DUF364 domain-containing protein [Fibrobacterota bacterium]
MEAFVRETLVTAITDRSVLIEDIHLFRHWVVVKAGRYEMSTCFTATLGLTEDSRDTWLGGLIGQNAAETAEKYLAAADVLRIAVGMACLKCVIPSVSNVSESSAFAPFSEQTRTQPSCFIGHFHDAAAWRDEGRPVSIVELQPRPGDIHWNDAHAVLSRAELVFMTGLTLVNGTFGEVIRRTPNATVRVIMGPTVPLTPALFKLGLHWLGTCRILDIAKTLRYFSLGGGSILYAPEGALQKINIGTPH